jgi:hypothetical protein
MTELPVLPPAPSRRADPVPVIAANVVPIAGMLFLHWSPPALLALYALDTALALCAMCWLVMVHVTEAGALRHGAGRAMKIALGALIGGAFLSFMLIAPVAITFADGDWLRSHPWRDSGFLTAAAMQAAGSLVGLVRTHRELVRRTDDEPYLATQFRFLVARWAIVLAVAFLGVGPALGDALGSALLVVVYAGASVWFTLFPEQALRLFHPRKPAARDPARR